jgi:hypothetical protein
MTKDRRTRQGLLRDCAGQGGLTVIADMSPSELKALSDPSLLTLPLQALWHDAHGAWERAHEVCQQAGNRDGDWVHAYLHRKEGDPGNAGYWYARARRPVPAATVSLDQEWADLVRVLAAEA